LRATAAYRLLVGRLIENGVHIDRAVAIPDEEIDAEVCRLRAELPEGSFPKLRAGGASVIHEWHTPYAVIIVDNTSGIPAGKGLAIGLYDLGLEHHAMWIIVRDEDGSVWWTPNPLVRFQSNLSAGRVPETGAACHDDPAAWDGSSPGEGGNRSCGVVGAFRRETKRPHPR
jgi:hypothetical protein